jgi:hypothetical protein
MAAEAAASGSGEEEEQQLAAAEALSQRCTTRAAALAAHGSMPEPPTLRLNLRRSAAAGVAKATAAAAAALAAGSSSDDDEAVVALMGLAGAAAAPSSPSQELSSHPVRSNLTAARERAAAAGVKNRQRIAGQHKPNGEPKDFQVGDAVLLALPRGVHSGLADSKLICRIVQINDYRGTPSRFKLRCNTGLLKDTYTPSELSDGSAAAADLSFTDTQRQGIPTVTVKEAASAAAAQRRQGRPAQATCGCKSGCNARCPCRKNNRLCSRDCKCKAHKGSCENYH